MLSTARKSLLATAVIAAAACATSPVSASDVTISGIMDLGLQVRHTSHETATTMESGSNKSSVVDINAKEDLENGLHAGVYLSSRISADTGSMFNSPILFDQSTVNLGGDFGDFYLGRMGALKSPDGKMSAFALTQGFSPMASNMLGTGLFCVFKTDGTLNNAVGYRSPKLAGHQISLQYSNGTTTEVGDSQKDDRLFSTAVTYNNGTRLRYGAIYTYHTHKTIDVDQRATQDLMVSANYDFDGFRLYATYQHVFNGAQPSAMLGAGAFNFLDTKKGFDTDAVMLGVGMPMLGGSLSAVLQGNRSKYNGDAAEGQRTVGYRVSPAAIYRYPFSKRTTLWSAVSWSHGWGMYKDVKSTALDQPTATTWGLGLTHTF